MQLPPNGRKVSVYFKLEQYKSPLVI